MTNDRRCPVCGGSLNGRRSVAIYDRPACRREANRVAHLLAGRTDSGYTSLDEYAQRRRIRANRPVGE